MKNNTNINATGTINTITRQVEFYYDETDTFTELYRNVNYKKDASQGSKYYARYYAYGEPIWYSVYGVDDGYCELGSTIKDEIVFEIVSEIDKNTVLLTQGNGIDYKYPTQKQWVNETLKSIIVPVSVITVVTIITVMASTGLVSQIIIRKSKENEK